MAGTEQKRSGDLVSIEVPHNDTGQELQENERTNVLHNYIKK